MYYVKQQLMSLSMSLHVLAVLAKAAAYVTCLSPAGVLSTGSYDVLPSPRFLSIDGRSSACLDPVPHGMRFASLDGSSM